MLHFWQTLEKPIIGMAPMDGVTDFACRAIVAKYAKPSVLFTEFTTAEGMFYAPERILRDFEYSEIERPIVAQIYGHRPEDFYKTAHIVCELGFDGIDINMGCPAKSVVAKNCGAKLITVPDLALELIRATRAGVADWARGQTLEDLKISEKLIQVVHRMNITRSGKPLNPTRKTIPYSVKTRIGFDSVVIDSWIETLLSESPAVISIHGRTLKQMYKGKADWSAIARAVQIAKGSSTLILGNGDLKTFDEVQTRIDETGVDGVLIGRACIGNPWIFRHQHSPEISTATLEERIQLTLEHAWYYENVRGPQYFKNVKKHMVGYLSHFPEAARLRSLALNTRNHAELKEVLTHEFQNRSIDS